MQLIELIHNIDKIYSEYLSKEQIPEKSVDFSSEIRQIVLNSNVKIDVIIRNCNGYTVFINNCDTWKVIRIEHNSIYGEVEFEACEGMTGNWIRIVFFKDFYCVFHNWRGCSYGDYSEPYVCAYDYRSLQRKIKINGYEVDLLIDYGRDWESINATIRENFKAFYQCLKERGFDTDTEVSGLIYSSKK